MFKTSTFKFIFLIAVLIYSVQSNAQTDYSFVTVGCNRVAGGADSAANAPSTANVYQLKRLFDEVAALSPLPKFLFLTGDIVLGYGNDTSKLAQQLWGWRALYEAHPISTMSGITLVAIPGNHETQYSNVAAGTKLSYTAAEQTWLRVMAPYIRGNNGPAATGLIPNTDSLITDQSRMTYSFNLTINGHVDHFLTINTDPTGRDARVPYRWIKNDLNTAKANGARHIFAFGHKPAYPTYWKQTDGLVAWPAQRDSFWLSMENNHAEAMFCAHNHLWEKQQPHIGKTWQIIAGNGGSATDVPNTNPASYFGWTLVKVNSDGTIQLESYGRDQNPASYYASVATLAGANYTTTLRNTEELSFGKYVSSISPSLISFPQNCSGGCNQVLTVLSNIPAYSITGIPFGYTVSPASGAFNTVLTVTAITSLSPVNTNLNINISGYYVSSTPGLTTAWIGSSGPINKIQVQQAGLPNYAVSVWTNPGSNLNWNDPTGFAPNWTDGNTAVFTVPGAPIIMNQNYLANGLIFPTVANYSFLGAGALNFTPGMSVITVPATGSAINIFNPLYSQFPLTLTGGTATSSVVNLFGAHSLSGINVKSTMRLNINTNSFTGLGLISSAPNTVLQFSNLSGISTPVTIPSNFNLMGSITSIGATKTGTLIYTGKISGTSDIWLGNDPTDFTSGANTSSTLLYGKNNYTGFTVLTGKGTVKLCTDNALPPATTLNFKYQSNLDLNGYNLTVAGLTITGATSGGIINSSANPSTLTLNSTKNFTYSLSILNNIGLIKQGAGSLTITAPTSFTGGTILNGGSLFVNSPGVLAGGSNVNAIVNSFAFLGGNGTINSNIYVNSNATLSPGSVANFIGKLTTGAITLNSGSAINFDINSVATAPGINQDFITNNGGLAFNCTSVPGSMFTLKVVAPTVAGFINNNAYVWNILTTAGVISNFDPGVVTVNSVNFGPSMGGGSFVLTTTSTALQLQFFPSTNDITPPIPTFYPTNNSNSASISVQPTLTFYESIVSVNGAALTNVNIASALALNLNNATGPGVAFTASISGSTITITPSALIAGQKYYVGLIPGAIQDASGNVTTVPQGISFIVANTPPSIFVSTTTTYLLNLPVVGPGFSTATVGDPSDPAMIYGFDFLINDAESPVAQLTVTGTSSNTAVVDNNNISISGNGSIRNIKLVPSSAGYTTLNISVTDGNLSSSYTINFAASSTADNPVGNYQFNWYTGTQETSSAWAVDPNYMLVEDDENNAIRLYNRYASGLPVAVFDMQPYLSVAGSTGKDDIEASVSIPGTNKIYWTSSYSNTSSGNNDPNRRYLFLTTISGAGSTTGVGFVKSYNNLRQDLINWDNSNGAPLGFASGAAAGVPSEVTNGFNVEGMTLAPNNIDLYLCFRAPQLTAPGSSVRNRALVVSISGFEANFANGAFPGTAFSYFTLDLGGRVIREIKKNSNNDYLISAGPTSGTPPFALFTWNGDPNTMPVQRDCDLVTLNNNGFDGLGAYESIVDVPNPLLATSQIQLMQDCGDSDFFTHTGQSYKGEPVNWMKFRGDVVTLGKYYQIISFPAIPDVLPGSTVTGYLLNATATSGLPVAYTITSTPPNIAVLIGNTLSFTGIGNVTVSGTQSGDGTWSTAPGISQSFTINGTTPAITFNGFNMTVGGPAIDLSTILLSNSTGAKSFIVNGNAASVSGSNLTAINAGTVTITGSVAASFGYNAGSKTVIVDIVSVTSAPIAINPSVTFDGFVMTVGGTTDLSSLLMTNSDGTKSFSESGDAVTLTGSTLTAIKAGNATVTVDLSSTSGFNAISAMAVITVVSSVPLSVKDFEAISFVLYPNPVVDGIVHFTTKISGSIYNVAGIEVRKFIKVSQVNVSGLPKGTYVVKTNTNEFRKFVIE